MLEFTFSLAECCDTPHEFDLGYMEIEIGSQKITSRDLLGRGQMMIFLSITSLLDGVISLVNNNNYSFAGEDSSFAFILKKRANGDISLIYDKREFCKVALNDLVKATWAASENLYQKYGQHLEGSGAAKEGWDYMRCKYLDTYDV
jgi:hypothetical protein